MKSVFRAGDGGDEPTENKPIGVLGFVLNPRRWIGRYPIRRGHKPTRYEAVPPRVIPTVPETQGIPMLFEVGYLPWRSATVQMGTTVLLGLLLGLLLRSLSFLLLLLLQRLLLPLPPQLTVSPIPSSSSWTRSSNIGSLRTSNLEGKTIYH